MMTKEQKMTRAKRAQELKASGLSYEKVAEIMGINRQSVLHCMMIDVMVKPGPGECETCGNSVKKRHRHHPDYSQPSVVKLLCPSCHGKTPRKHGPRRHPPKLRHGSGGRSSVAVPFDVLRLAQIASAMSRKTMTQFCSQAISEYAALAVAQK